MEPAIRPRTYAQALERLRRIGLRPTRQRLALAKLLFEQGDRHVTAEQLHEEAEAAKVRVSLATVYNSLHQFTQLGLLREVVVEAGAELFRHQHLRPSSLLLRGRGQADGHPGRPGRGHPLADPARPGPRCAGSTSSCASGAV